MAACGGVNTRVLVRDINGVQEIEEVERLQQEVWGLSDREIVPVVQLAPVRDLGGTLIGAFDGDELAGFVYGFVGYENGAAHLHSEMLGVRPSHRNRGIGCALKLAQRERALAQGFNLITWTYDPLRTLNAHLNIARLGAVADGYKVDYYGESTSSRLHVCGTDRLWVRWYLNSDRVVQRLKAGATGAGTIQLPEAIRLVEASPNKMPVRRSLPAKPVVTEALLEIPADLLASTRQDLWLVMQWREATRQAFSEAIGRGYVVEEFQDGVRPGVCAYLLRLQFSA